MKTNMLAPLAFSALVSAAAQVKIWSQASCQGDSKTLPNGLYCETYSGMSAQALSSDNGIHYECLVYDNMDDCTGGGNPTTNPGIHELGDDCYTPGSGASATSMVISCQDNNPLKA